MEVIDLTSDNEQETIATVSNKSRRKHKIKRLGIEQLILQRDNKKMIKTPKEEQIRN